MRLGQSALALSVMLQVSPCQIPATMAAMVWLACRQLLCRGVFWQPPGSTRHCEKMHGRLPRPPLKCFASDAGDERGGGLCVAKFG